MSAKKANCASAKIGGQWTTAERVWYRWIAAVQHDLAANHGRRGSASPRNARRRRHGRTGGPGRANSGRPSGSAAESGAETPDHLRRSARIVAAARCRVLTPGWGKNPPPRISAENVSTANRSRSPMPSKTVEWCRACEYQQVGPDHCNPVERGRRHHRDSHVRADLDRAIHQQFGRDESECTREAHARQAREQEANRQRGGMRIEPLILGERKPSETSFHGTNRQSESLRARE